MADALSAVAANASPRAVAKPSWLASRKPFAERLMTEAPPKIIASSLALLRHFIFANVLVQRRNGNVGTQVWRPLNSSLPAALRDASKFPEGRSMRVPELVSLTIPRLYFGVN